MIVLFLLVLINILIVVGRLQKKAWAGKILSVFSFLLLLVAALFMVRILL